MNGPELFLGFFAGSILAVLLTALRLVLVRRLGADGRRTPPVVPPSAEVLDAERNRRPSPHPLSNRRQR